jgi:hypothetical protein
MSGEAVPKPKEVHAKKTKYKELEENNTFHIGSNCVCG